jgi:hypothetical protein
LRFARIKNYRFPHVLWHDGGESERHATRKYFTLASTPIYPIQKTGEVVLRKMQLSVTGLWYPLLIAISCHLMLFG